MNCDRSLFERDLEAFWDAFYAQYRAFVYNQAWTYRNNLFDVEDLVQETWLGLCSKGSVLCDYSEPQRLAYIAVTVRNKAISLARKVDQTVSLDEIANMTYNHTDLINEVLDRNLKVKKFRKVWSHVPPQAREVLERKYILLESDAEIAQAMGIRKDSVRMYLTRARKAALAELQVYKNSIL